VVWTRLSVQKLRKGVQEVQKLTKTSVPPLMNTNSRKLGLTTSEAARRLGVSLSTIRRWSDMGYLRSYRTPGGQRRFSIQQLDEFLASLEAEGSASDDSEPPQARLRSVERVGLGVAAAVVSSVPSVPEMSSAPSTPEIPAWPPAWPPADAA
jgi:excisionase family DNA binding protein